MIGGDLIVAIDDDRITDSRRLANVLNRKKVGQKITIEFYRDKRLLKKDIVLSEKDKRII